jgi:hypothetical protein
MAWDEERVTKLEARVEVLESQMEELMKAGAFGSVAGDVGIEAKFEEEKQRG